MTMPWLGHNADMVHVGLISALSARLRFQHGCHFYLRVAIIEQL